MTRPRAREFGIELGSMEVGRLNAITDVEGVGVGHSTLIERAREAHIVSHAQAESSVNPVKFYGKSAKRSVKRVKAV